MLTVVGMGPGSLALMTAAAQAAVAEADVLAGNARHLAQFPQFSGETFALGANIPALLTWITARQAQRVVVLASGDPLLYGIGSRLVAHFGLAQVHIIPGVSAVHYLCAKLGIEMNGIWLTSSHGREADFDEIARQPRVAMVTDLHCGPREIALALVARGLGDRWLAIGENLTLENERIHWQRARNVQGQYEMNVVVILNER